MGQVTINPPPWGPARDPHFEPTHLHEGFGAHSQVTVQQAIEKQWYYRSEWYKRLVPDTRRCYFHGEIMYEPLELTPEEQAAFYTDQDRGMATGPIG